MKWGIILKLKYSLNYFQLPEWKQKLRSWWRQSCVIWCDVMWCDTDVDEDDEDDDDDAEEGFDEIIAHDKHIARDDGPSARDIDGLLRGKDMWR